MPLCSAYNCNNIAIHSFPKDPIRRKHWINALRMKSNYYSKINGTTSRLCPAHFKESDYYGKSKYTIYAPLKKFLKKDTIPSKIVFTKKAKSPTTLERQLRSKKIYVTPGPSGTAIPRKNDDDFKWPYSDTDTDDDKNASEEEEIEVSKQHIEHHEIVEVQPSEIIEVKIEPPDEVDLDADKEDHVISNPILGSDGGASAGFSPFVRATNLNLPAINMFAILEFITNNNYYNTLDYDKLKTMIKPNNTKLLSGLRVQSREFVHRVSCTVHLQATSHCGIEYDTNTHTVTRSECMCSHATCEHVAALLMWLHCVTNQKGYNPKLVPDNVKLVQNTVKLVPNTVEVIPNTVKVVPNTVKVVPNTVKTCDKVIKRDPDGLLDSPAVQSTEDEVSLTCVDDPLNVPDVSEDIPGPSTAKRKKMPPSTTTPATTPGTYTMQVYKTKSTPKDTDTKTDESVIKCSFTRKCFYNVWRSTKGNFNEKLRHTRSIMSKAFHDANYVIDFLPLEKKLEELCMEIQGYWNDAENREELESKYAEWFAIVENIDMKKTKRDIVLG